MSNQFPSKRHKSFLENQPDNKYTHFFLNNDAKNSVDNTNNTSNLLSNSNLNRSKNDTQDLNISNEEELQKEIENNLNLINETSSEEEDFSKTLINRNNGDKDLECNKDDFKNFFKMLENSNNKNSSNYNNNEETNSVGSDCFDEFQDQDNNVNFNNFNNLKNINNSNNYSNPNFNMYDNVNPKKRHSHPLNLFNRNAKSIQNPNSLESSNNNQNNFRNNKINNQNSFNNNENNFNNLYCNYAPNFNFSEQQFYNISPNVNNLQQNANQFYSNALLNNNQNFNLTNATFNNNNNNNNNIKNSNNSVHVKNQNFRNNSSVSNYSNIPDCNNHEQRRNSLYSQEESENSIENYSCNVNTNAPAFNCQLQENLIAYNNLNANRRRSFNCLNNNANILGQDLFNLSPQKAFLNQQQARKSFIYPGCKNSPDYFNINLMPTAFNFNNPLDNEMNKTNNISDVSVPYNNPMVDFYANNNNNSSIEQNYSATFNPAFYPKAGNNAAACFSVDNFMSNKKLNNNSTNYHHQAINYFKMQAQPNGKIPASTACLYNNPNLNKNNSNGIMNMNYPNNTLKNNFVDSNNKLIYPTDNNINNTNKINSSCKIQVNQNQKFAQQLNINSSSQAISNSFNCKKPNKPSNNALSQCSSGAAQPDPHSVDDNYIIENITNFLKDQNGCRLLQKKIEEKKYDLIMSFYEAVVKKPNFIEVVNDQFGNYVIQKFLEVIYKDKAIMTTFFEKIESQIFDVSVNLYGTRVFQKALDLLEKNYHFIENDKINEVFKRLVVENMMELIVDTNGNHVFMKIIGIYPKNKNEFIFDLLFEKSKAIAMLKQGGTVFQKAFEHGSKSQKDKLVFEILSYINELINDEYGNFIIQQIVFMKNIEYNKIIVEFICNNVLMLSQQKFSSNVIDKCILLEDIENNHYIRVNIIQSIIDKKIIGELLIDQYGNYVVQKSLLKSEEENFNTLIQEIKNNLGLILSKPFGRKIYDNLVKTYSDYLGSLTSKQIINSQEEKYKHINQSIKKSKRNENEKISKI